MDKVIEGLVATTITLGGVLLLLWVAVISGAIGGAFTAWLTSLLFPTLALKITAVTGFKVYQLGAMIGFVGGYFRAQLSTKD